MIPLTEQLCERRGSFLQKSSQKLKRKGKGIKMEGPRLSLPLYVDKVLANRSSCPPELRIRSSRRVDPEGSRMGDGAVIPVPTR